MTETNLHQKYDEHQQSPWLDNLRRGWIHDGELQKWLDAGVRGITSNPSICLLYTSPSPRDQRGSRMPSSA